jgi:hypothetical protein
MVAMSEVIDPVKIEQPVTLTKAQEQKLEQWSAEGWILGREEAIKLIMDHYQTTEWRARKALKDAHEEVEHWNSREEDDNPDYDFAWKYELWEYLDQHPLLQQSKQITEQPEPVATKVTPPTPLRAGAARGRRPKYNWAEVRTFVFDRMDYHGDFDPVDREWSCQADLERAIGDYMGQQSPSESTLREYATKFYGEWKRRKGRKGR